MRLRHLPSVVHNESCNSNINTGTAKLFLNICLNISYTTQLFCDWVCEVQYQSTVDLETEQHKKRHTTYLPIQYIKILTINEQSPLLAQLQSPERSCCQIVSHPFSAQNLSQWRNNFFFSLQSTKQNKITHFTQFSTWLCKYFFNVLSLIHLCIKTVPWKMWFFSSMYISSWSPSSLFVPSYVRMPWFLEVMSDQ